MKICTCARLKSTNDIFCKYCGGEIIRGEKRDGASQMPKTAKIGVIPCSMAVLDSEPDLAQELAKVLNRNGIDAQLNTPDFILAKYLMDSLKAFRTAQSNNVEWHGAEDKMRRP